MSGETLRFIGPDAPEYAQELDLRWRVLREPLGFGRDAANTASRSDSGGARPFVGGVGSFGHNG